METGEPFAGQVERLFHEALELDLGVREGFVNDACDGNDALRNALQRLLDAAGRVASKPAWQEPAIQHEAQGLAALGNGDLERYRLLECIGSGGMGRVYKAVRADDEFSKLVAIKILHPLIDETRDGATARRFRQERQILAGLEHPNIARLLDGGSMPDGLPFLVMEFVDGIPLDRYVAEKRLPLRDCLQLFRQVCAAVSFAHRKLVVHRDLKPANILVTPEGTPKLLDFGIARLLDGSVGQTQTGAGPMTPEYASPEQIRGEATTTSCDVFSLGVLLYEIVGGVRLYPRLSGAELARAVCTETPPALSAKAGRSFHRDLENIVQMALRKEPERRYASVEQFSEDLRRYMEGYPVTARADTLGYRAGKFASRNRGALAGAAVIVLTLVAAVVATSREARLANQRFNEVRLLANIYLFEFHDAIRDLPGSTKARQLVVKRGLEYLDRLSQERGRDPELGRELAAAYQKVGAVQGAPNFPSLGDRGGALASYRKAIAILEPLEAASPANIQAGLQLSKAYRETGELQQFSGDLRAAAELDRKAAKLAERIVAGHPSSPPALSELALAYANLGIVTGDNQVQNLGDPKGAMACFEKARGIREKLVALNPADRTEAMYLAALYARIASVRQALGDSEGSLAAFRQAIEIDERLVREDPLNIMYRRETAVYHRSLSLGLIRVARFDEAKVHGDRSAQLFEQLAREDPANMEAQEAFADVLFSQGYLLANAKRPAEVLRYYNAAAAIYLDIMKKRPGNFPRGLRTVYQITADFGINAGDDQMVLTNANKELEIDARLLAADAKNASAQRNRGLALGQVGKAHEIRASRAKVPATRFAEWREARSWHQRSLDLWLEMQRTGILIPMYASALDTARKDVARCDNALQTQR